MELLKTTKYDDDLSKDSLPKIYRRQYVTLDHKNSLKLLGYICSNSPKYIVWVKIIKKIMPKVIRKLSRDHVPWRYFVNFLP